MLGFEKWRDGGSGSLKEIGLERMGYGLGSSDSMPDVPVMIGMELGRWKRKLMLAGYSGDSRECQHLHILSIRSA
jgi:hypothetical protein